MAKGFTREELREREMTECALQLGAKVMLDAIVVAGWCDLVPCMVLAVPGQSLPLEGKPLQVVVITPKQMEDIGKQVDSDGLFKPDVIGSSVIGAQLKYPALKALMDLVHSTPAGRVAICKYMPDLNGRLGV